MQGEQSSTVDTFYGSANHSGNEENKHDELTFQVAAVDSSALMVLNVCNRHSILKDNSWKCILHTSIIRQMGL